MPSDFISLLSSDLDLESPRCLYSRESVYDLLPKELQLPPSRETSIAPMSQTSGGEADEVGSPPPAVVAADASSSSSSMAGARSSFTTTSSPTINSTSVTDSKAMKLESCSLTVGVSNRGVSEKQLTSKTIQQQQTTPMRWRVLSISPPPEDLLDNSLMSCQDDGGVVESEQSSTMWMDDSTSNFSNMSTHSYNDNTEVPRKSRKRNTKERPGIKRHDCEESNMDVFDADSAKAPHYVLSQLTSDNKGSSQGNNGSSENQKAQVGNKSPTLCGQHPSKCEGKELKIVVQPETQHRARYLTEGSRGSVKDRTQQGFPTVKLEGYNEPVVLQVFVGNDSGRVKPHGFYQACRVTGRNTTPCKEVDIDGTTVIEVSLDPSSMMTLAVDCVGILKLRNADVEARIGIAGSKKKSTRARLVFRVNITRKDGSVLTLQTSSSPILCTQPAGLPEILKKSLHSCSVKGGEEVFLIGKNFLKGAKVLFQENISDEDSWKAEAEIDMELFHQNHLVVKVPPYQDQEIASPVSVGIYVVTNAGRSHEVHPFTYTPDACVSTNMVKKELAASAQPCSFENAVKAIKTTSCNMDSSNSHSSALTSPLIQTIIVKSEDVDPMELTTESEGSPVFKTTNVVGPPPKQLTNMPTSGSFSSSVSLLDGEKTPIQTKGYNPETMSPLQTQDIPHSVQFRSVPVPSQNTESLLQPTVQFPRRDTQSDVLQTDSGVVNLTQMAELSQQQQAFGEQAQTLHQQMSSNMFSPANVVNHLQNTIQQMQTGSFPSSPVTTSSANVDLVQQVLEAQQKLSAVLFSGPGSGESTKTVSEQMNPEIFQRVNQIQSTVGSGMFSSPDTSTHSRPDSLPGRSENVISQTESALSNQQQAMDTSSSLVMGMQQSIHQTTGPMQSDLFAASGSTTGSIQQSPVYGSSSHIMSGLAPSEDLHMQCDLFSPSVSGNESNGAAQQDASTTSSNIFQSSNSADGDESPGKTKQMQSNIFQAAIVQMQHSGESQPPVSIFSSPEMMAVQTSGTQQQAGSIFQQSGEMVTLQSGNFIQQTSNISQSPLFHPSKSIGDAQNMSQENQGSIFHNPNTIEQHQNSVSSPDQMQSPLFHSPNTMTVLQGTSTSPDHQSAHLFISQNSLNSLPNNGTSQDKNVSFFTNQNSHNPHQVATNAEQSTFQQQSQMSHMQGTPLSQEQQPQQNMFQSQHQSQKSLFQPQQQTQQGMFQSPQQSQEDIFQVRQQPQQDMFQSHQQPQQDVFQSHQQPQQDVFQSHQQSQQDVFHSQQQPSLEVFQSQQHPPQDMFQAHQSPQQDMLQSQQQLPQELFQSQPQPQQDMFQSPSQPQQDMFQSQSQPQQDLFQSPSQPQQDLFQSQSQPQQDLFQTQQQLQQDMFQSQHESQQELFQSQMSMSTNQQGSMFQSQHSIVGIPNTSVSQEQQQGIVFSNQNTMSSQEQQQNMLYTTSQSLMSNQEQQNQTVFHSQNRPSMNQEEQPMQFEGQSSCSSLQNSASSQSEQQQSSIFHNAQQIQIVQGTPNSQEQQVTLFITSASMSALQNSINQQEIQQSSLFTSANNLGGIQVSTSASQQQASLFHSTAGGALNQLQNSPPSSQQTSGLFLFGIQNNCGQLLSPAQATVPDQLMALSQDGQAQDEEQSVVTLLSQQMSETSSISSSASNNQNMEKINDLLVSLQSHSNSMPGSF
ncbi:nuclear factor of activated T-cells 5 isoform X1 [Pleurodeles waltl]|uniref:nuclear factor of activated T-cells 5 isoform X1 n=1 Tax=Pleurodeles waltl TaxID=8319 RepID=UPI003709C492